MKEADKWCELEVEPGEEYAESGVVKREEGLVAGWLDSGDELVSSRSGLELLLDTSRRAGTCLNEESSGAKSEIQYRLNRDYFNNPTHSKDNKA